MIVFIYNSLESIGFTHPLHPAITHITMGMAMGAFLFRLASYKKKELAQTAHDCLVLALVFLPLTAILGIMDWQYRYLGKVSNLIVAKIVLATTLALLLSLTIYLFRKKKGSASLLTLLYFLCMMNAIPLGFIGGKLIFD